jgi:hypothetical protein
MSIFGCFDDDNDEVQPPYISPEQKLREKLASGTASSIGVTLASFDDPKALKHLVTDDASIWRTLGSRLARARLEEIPGFSYILQSDLKGLTALTNKEGETIISQTLAFMAHYKTPEPVRTAIFSMFNDLGLNVSAADVAASARQFAGRG